MKRIAFVLLLITAVNVCAQWEVINEGNLIYSIDFVNENTGWATGSGNHILKTTDGGDNWEVIKLNEEWTIGVLKFYNESVGWATGGKAGVNFIIKTTDGGHNWTIQKELSEWFNSIQIIDENNIYLSAYNTLYKTINGGSTWEKAGPPVRDTIGFNSFWFRDTENGITTGNYFDGNGNVCIIFNTSNGGAYWQEKKTYDFYTISDIKSVNDSTLIFKAYEDTLSFLCRSNDMLQSWEILAQWSGWAGNFSFTDEDTGYVIMGGSSGSGEIMKTTDGGLNWIKLPSPGINKRVSLLNIFSAGSDNVFIIGMQGMILRSTNGGYDWVLKKHAYSFYSSRFSDKSSGILFGGFYTGFHETIPSGDIFTTTDGGKTLKPVYTSNDVFESSEAVSDSVFLASGRSIYKTGDGGKTWNIKYTVTPDPVGSMFGRDLNTIKDLTHDNKSLWGAGRNYDPILKKGKAIILNSTDSGETWKEIWQKTDSGEGFFNYLTSLHVSDTSGWAVGSPGLIVQYTKEGWIEYNSLTDLPLHKVVSFDSTVWISGGYSSEQSIFMKTTNLGATWRKDQGIPYVINDFVFIDKNLGWAVGFNKDYRGVLLKTTTGGSKWEPYLSDLAGPLKSIYLNGNNAWAVGERGLVIRTTNAGLTWVDDNGNIDPDNYSLEQNYPNPFNPATVIRWYLPHSEKVKLTVYDALGREAIVLIDEAQTAGVHKTTFYAGNFPSGVYYYQLKSGSFTETKKMLLIK